MDTFLRMTQDYYPNYLRTEAFKGLVRTLKEDPRALARLTIGLLDHIALDPLEGDNIIDFVSYSGPDHALTELNAESESIWFYLHLNRVTNFIGSFTLPRSAPECAELFSAIQRNLDSKMFKAAAMHRRLEKLVPSRTRRIERKGRIAFQAVIDNAMLNPLYTSRADTEEVRNLRDVVLADARIAAAAVNDPLFARREQRHRKVIDASTSAVFGQSYPGMLATFATKYVVPEGQRLVADMM